MKLPVYDIMIDLDSDELNMSCISLVSDPAVERDFECFSKDKKPMQFSITDHDKHCITGVAIRADVPIYRYSPDMGEYYVRFTKETIEQIVYKYSKQNLWNSVSLEHSGKNIDTAVMVEFFTKSPSKCPAGFEDVEDGSLMVTYKITDDNLWDTVKNSDEINGFSIEIMADLKPTDEFVESENDDFWTELMEWLQGEDFESKKKSEFEVSKGTIRRAIDDGKVILVDEGGKKAVEYWPHSLGKKDDKDAVVLYNPDTDKWSVKTLKGMDCVVSDTPVGEFVYTDPSYEEIMDDDDVVVTRTRGTSSYSDLIHNRVMCMISYNDEKDKPALGFRQCAVIAHGYTKASNECIRVMEVFGDSRSVREGDGVIPDYRLLLTKRIKSLKPMVGTAPWGWDVLDARVNLTGDKSMAPCITHITTEDLDKE
jgi:hypothetical protein